MNLVYLYGYPDSPGAGAKFSDYNLGALSNGGANATAAGLDVSGNIFNDISQISIYLIYT